MKKVMHRLQIVLLSLVMALSSSTFAGAKGAKMQQQKRAVKRVVEEYFGALSHSNLSAIDALFHDRSVFIPEPSQQVVGQKAIRKLHQQQLQHIDSQLSLKNAYVSINGDIAVVHAITAGKITMSDSDISIPVEDRDTFVMVNLDGQWKIDRYVFKGDLNHSAVS